MKKLPITLVVITYNDADRLEKLIQKHKHLVEEVIVVDQGSTDSTPAVCEKLADLTFHKRRKGVSDPDRLWAHSLGKSDYVLYLDTDEYLSDKAIELLPKLVEANFDCVWFNRKNLVDGVDIEKILGNDPQLRLFKKGSVRYPERDHVYPEVANGVKVAHVDAEIVHARTLEGLKKAHKARESLYSAKHVSMQHRFVAQVAEILEANVKEDYK